MKGDGHEIDAAMLHRAALAGLRGRGHVEPNPCVGCVIGRERGDTVDVLAIGHHRVFGGPHAEVEAIRACSDRGADPRGATAWVTLEPCNHHGKTGPCSEALLAAGIARVVCARRDPNPLAAGGFDRLRAAGVRVEVTSACEAATRLADPWVKRLAMGRPWTIIKWAQTSDWFVAFPPGGPRWISSPASRRAVHRLRGRVDAVITGIGTVLADDPLLTVRGVPARRTPRRVILDSGLRTPASCALARSAREAPVLIATTASALAARSDHASALSAAGVELIALPERNGRASIDALLDHLAAVRGVTNALVEGGPKLIDAFIREGFADELLVFTAGSRVGDDSRGEASGGVPIGAALTLARQQGFEIVRRRETGGDERSMYLRPQAIL